VHVEKEMLCVSVTWRLKGRTEMLRTSDCGWLLKSHRVICVVIMSYTVVVDGLKCRV